MRDTKLTIFTLGLFLFSFFFVFPTQTSAITPPTVDVTNARGTVLDSDGNPVKFARVYGTCDGDTARGITTSKGQFSLYFVNKDKCKAGSVVNVTLEKDGETYNGTGIVQIKRDGKYVDINITVLNFEAINVPEFNISTLIFTFFSSIVLYLLFKNKFKLIPIKS